METIQDLVPWALLVLLALTLAVLVLALSSLRALRRQARRTEDLERRLGETDKKRVEESVGPVLSQVQELREELNGRLLELAGALGEAQRSLGELADREGRPAGLGAELEPLLREVVESIDARVREIGSSLGDRRIETVEDSVVRVLGDRGFSDVVLLGEPVREGDRLRVQVEAKRDGMTYKGPMFLEGATVVEQRLTPSYPMFP